MPWVFRLPVAPSRVPFSPRPRLRPPTAQGLKGAGVPGLRLDSALHQGLLGTQCCASLTGALLVPAAAMPGGDMALLCHGGFSVENIFLKGTVEKVKGSPGQRGQEQQL